MASEYTQLVCAVVAPEARRAVHGASDEVVTVGAGGARLTGHAPHRVAVTPVGGVTEVSAPHTAGNQHSTTKHATYVHQEAA